MAKLQVTHSLPVDKIDSIKVTQVLPAVNEGLSECKHPPLAHQDCPEYIYIWKILQNYSVPQPARNPM